MSDLPNGRALAKCYLIDKDDKFTLNQRIGGFHTLDENIVVTKYLFYILDRNWQLLKYDNGVDQTNLKKDDILNISIPVPAIDVQKRLVYMLDKVCFALWCKNTCRSKSRIIDKQWIIISGPFNRVRWI